MMKAAVHNSEQISHLIRLYLVADTRLISSDEFAETEVSIVLLDNFYNNFIF